MDKLKKTTIYRAGITARYLKWETTTCWAKANVGREAVELSFHLKSKGGGTTQVLVRIGLGDLPQLMNTVVDAMPEKGRDILEQATAAQRRSIERLAEAHLNERNSAATRPLLTQLKSVLAYVEDRYWRTVDGEDSELDQAYCALGETVTSLERVF